MLRLLRTRRLPPKVAIYRRGKFRLRHDVPDLARQLVLAADERHRFSRGEAQSPEISSAGSLKTPRWRKADSNRWSHFRRSRFQNIDRCAGHQKLLFDRKNRIEFPPWPDEFHDRSQMRARLMDQAAHSYLSFETAAGFCGIAWNSVGVTRFQFPTRSPEATKRILLRRGNELSRLCLGVLRTAAGELLSTDDIAGRVIAGKGFDTGDAILRAAIREQVGSIVKRLHRNGGVENIGVGRASKWKLAADCAPRA
jgi:hypothetical protein